MILGLMRKKSPTNNAAIMKKVIEMTSKDLFLCCTGRISTDNSTKDGMSGKETSRRRLQTARVSGQNLNMKRLNMG